MKSLWYVDSMGVATRETEIMNMKLRPYQSSTNLTYEYSTPY